MVATRPLIIVLVICFAGLVSAEDWPTYQRDPHRTGYSPEQVVAERLERAWTWRSPATPQPAWAGPAKWDAYAGHRDLPSMRSYDLCFQPISAATHVFFGSSADDTLYCLDAATGAKVWTFTSDGPIRTAPTFSDGRVYFGSDDGNAYCLAAESGKLIWKFRPVETDKWIVNNGRFIPFHPCRTGVLIDGAHAYFGCALLPWKKSFLCAVDRLTGKVDGSSTYIKELPGATLEGPPAATSELLVFPQGRVAPRVFRRNDGGDQGPLKKSSGGSIVVVSLDENVFHGPGADSRKGGINSSNLKTREVVATHGRGNAMVVADAISYMLTDDSIVASDLARRKNLWVADCDQPYSLIGAQGVLFAGGRNEVVAYRAKDGAVIWQRPTEGRVYGLALAGGRLLASTDLGIIHCFAMDTERDTDASPVETQAEQQPLAAIEPVSDPGLISRWVFQKPHVQSKVVRDLQGRNEGRIEGEMNLVRAGEHTALLLDGRKNSVLITSDHTQADLPTRSMTVEAWVRVDQPQAWGGIVGAIQDNGRYERGWILGLRDARFSFALAGKEGTGSLTYLTADEDFAAKAWYHLAGVYDGSTMKLYVDGEVAGESSQQSGDINYPPRAFFEIGAYHDQDENFRLKGQLHEVRLYRRALTAEEILEHVSQLQTELPERSRAKPADRLAAGPWLQFLDPETAIVRWMTEKSTAATLDLWFEDEVTSLESPPGTEHSVKLVGLKRNRLYRYQIRGADFLTREFECDTFFNFTLPRVASTTPRDETIAQLNTRLQPLLEQEDMGSGLGFLVGSQDGRLAHEIVRHSALRLVVLEEDQERVGTARKWLQAQGVYGSRVTVRHVTSYDDLPFSDCCANVILSALPLPKLRGAASEVLRMLRPDGGVACFGSNTDPAGVRDWWQEVGVSGEFRLQLQDDTLLVQRGELAGSGAWSHLYGSSDNSAFGGEQLAGARSADDLEVQWIGRPGPRFKPDRNGRKPAPLSTGGRFFLQGLHRMAALDAYNGSVLWSLEIPEFERFNMPRDSGNWCADREFVFAVVRDKCWQIEAATGRVVEMHDVVTEGARAGQYEWGAVVSRDHQLLGTAVKAGTAWNNFWGNADAGWYDARSGPVTDKICADNVFSVDKQTGKREWTYSDGVIINSTLTVHENVIYFVESRNQEVVGAEARRIGNPKLWDDQFLVALDAYTGTKIWEKPIDTEDGKVVFYLAGGSNGRLVVVSSNEQHYHVYAFSTEEGQEVWKQTFRWPGGKGDHGKAMSRPAIVDNRLFVRPHVFQLSDGERLPQQMPGGGCGTYACSANAVFFRAGRVTMWNEADGKSSGWDRLRPDCWLSAIPAAGMLLSAEGGGGCSCGTWMETSVGFLPKVREPDAH